ncbi:MAG: manganese efflux pump [Erysipelotrichaceae bacterium]|nr:manganese efflux pump [Erysipelotrichaceae bacterium]
MNIDFLFVVNSLALGAGLAMDAFSVSLANGLNEPKMSTGRMNLIAGTFAFFQWLMPMLGWVCVHTILQYFTALQAYIPWIALILLVYIGGKMLLEARNQDEESEAVPVSLRLLAVQGVATSIDALSVGFTIAEYDFTAALIASLIIGVVTYVICLIGLKLGRVAGMKYASKASVLGGVILILIGLEIFIRGIMGI